MTYLINIFRRLLGRIPRQAPTPMVCRTVTADETRADTVYFVRTSKGIVVLY